ncbi:NLR family CARD domain-containing protein 3 [Tachyglossus aculeatus]|uniref:NLR family CARD domain-containing protein 3 n=1 Tax=Tachyglossus aculeatus TaxID=9261 RepID=UPI0018F67E6C|nr:NLR family CARD domain-containing protein 3 [Tachyglossus aculeatus]
MAPPASRRWKGGALQGMPACSEGKGGGQACVAAFVMVEWAWRTKSVSSNVVHKTLAFTTGLDDCRGDMSRFESNRKEAVVERTGEGGGQGEKMGGGKFFDKVPRNKTKVGDSLPADVSHVARSYHEIRPGSDCTNNQKRVASPVLSPLAECLEGPCCDRTPPAPGSWLRRHQKQLLQAISSPLLDEILGSAKKQEVLRGEEAGEGCEAASLAGQVKALVDLVARKGTQGSWALQTFIENSDSQLCHHLTARTPGVYNSVCGDPTMQRYLEFLHKRFGSGPDPTLSASQRLTKLLLVEGLTDLQQKDHDFVQIEATRGGRRASRSIAFERLFSPLSKVSIPPRVSVTVGVAGIGKSSTVKLYVGLWLQRKVGQDIKWVLPLSFQELNALDKLSADRLVHLVSANACDATQCSSARVLLILDGLDEFKTPLDFSNTVVCTDPKKEIPVDGLVTNIIRGNLLLEASVWVTSRPTAAGQIPGGLVDRMTEIRGFDKSEIEDYLNRLFPESPDLAVRVLRHVGANPALYLLCTVPSFCRLCGVVLGCLLKGRPDHQPPEASFPKSLSELYASYFKMALCGDWPDRPKESLRTEQAASGKRLLGALGRLAFVGLVKKRYVFSEPDLKAHGVELSLLQANPRHCLFLKEEAQGSVHYYFAHLSLQEFAAATYYYGAAKRALFDLFSDNGMSWFKLGFLTHYRNALQKALQAEDGRLDVFLRFLSGLLSPRVNRLLAGWLLVKEEHDGYRGPIRDLLQDCLRPKATVSSRMVNIMRCLQELQCPELAQTVEEAMASESLAGKLTPLHRSALAYVLQVSEACSDETNLSRCLNHGILESLLAQILYCRNLRMDSNQFQDSVMELLASVLSGKDCLIEKLSLAENEISNKGAKALARSLMVNRSLTALDLRGNSIGPQGAKALADALKINRVLLSLKPVSPAAITRDSPLASRHSLQNNKIKDDGAKALAHVLATNNTLSILHLQKNSIGPIGAKALASALRQNRTLKKLMFSGNGCGNEGSEALAEALKLNQGLITLDLQSNSISNAGIPALTQALCANKTLINLNLRENSIGSEGAREIANALRTNRTLKDLDLAANLLREEGAQALAVAVKENQTLTSLHLQWNFIQSSAAKALAQALQFNRSLTSLYLQENEIGDEGAAALAGALKVNGILSALYLQMTSIRVLGAQALGEALTVNKTLEILDLRGNAIGLAGAKAMASALKVNASLRLLNLQENTLGMDGALFISAALSGNHGLKHINLQGNGIGENGAKMISSAIKNNAPSCIVEI